MGEMQSTNSEHGTPYLATHHILSFPFPFQFDAAPGVPVEVTEYVDKVLRDAITLCNVPERFSMNAVKHLLEVDEVDNEGLLKFNALFDDVNSCFRKTMQKTVGFNTYLKFFPY